MLGPSLLEGNEDTSRNIYLFNSAGPQYPRLFRYEMHVHVLHEGSEEKASRLFSLNAYSHDHLYQNRFRHLRLPSGGF